MIGPSHRQLAQVRKAKRSCASPDTQFMSQEIKDLLFGRKAMIKLDSILKSRDITLLTKIHLVKAMVFSYGCESWAIKIAECQRIDVFEHQVSSC